MFGSSLSPVVCRGAHVLFKLFVFICVVVSKTYCILFFFILCTLCCHFLWIVHFFIAHSAFCNIYLLLWISDGTNIYRITTLAFRISKIYHAYTNNAVMHKLTLAHEWIAIVDRLWVYLFSIFGTQENLYYLLHRFCTFVCSNYMFKRGTCFSL